MATKNCNFFLAPTGKERIDIFAGTPSLHRFHFQIRLISKSISKYLVRGSLNKIYMIANLAMISISS